MLDVSYWCINELLCMICVCVWLYVWKKWVERWRWWLMAGVGWCVGLSARRNVLEINLSDGLDNMGSVKASLAMCLMTVFLLVYFSLWKGVRSSGKVILSLHPFFFLLWFFICFFLCFFSPPLSLPVLIMHRNRNMERWKPLKCEDVESMWGRQQRHAPLRFCFTSIPVRSWSELASCCNAPRSAIDFISIGIARSRRNETEREKESRFNDKRDWLFASLPCINLMEPLATTPLFFLFFFWGGRG